MGIGPRLTRALAIQLACMPVGALAAPNFTPLGDFAGGNFDSHAAALSADGTSVVGYGTVAGGVSGTQMAFRWTTGTGMQPLGDLPGAANYSNAFGVNNNGTIVVGESSTTDPSGPNDRMTFVWTPGGGMQGLGFGYGTSGGHYETGRGVSNDGLVIAGGANELSANPISYRWTSGGGFQTLINQTNFGNTATGISAAGNVIIGRARLNGADQGWVWTAGGGVQPLPDLAGGATESTAAGISPSGTYIVGYGTDATGFRPVLWTNGVPQALAPGPNTTAYGVSDDGTIVGGGNFTLADGAFIWDPVHGAYPAKAVFELGNVTVPSGWRLSRVTGVSADGLSFAGDGFNAANQPEAWYVHLDVSPIVPEPGSVSLLVLPLAAGCARRSRVRPSVKNSSP